jgi:hypothetical protein
LTKIEKLNDRIQPLEPKPAQPEDLSDQAFQAWISAHLTEDETLTFARMQKNWKDKEPENPTELELDRYKALLSAAVERAGREPESNWEEFKQKWVRAETLRHTPGRQDVEKLRELNNWFLARVNWNLEKARLGPWKAVEKYVDEKGNWHP